MISQYTIANFKAFGSPSSVPIKPITLVYGENSSGKSSIIQSFLLLKQTLEDSENRDILLAPKGRLVDLGGFREFIFAHDLSRSFTVSFSLRTKVEDLPSWTRDTFRLLQTDELKLTLFFKYVQEQANAVLERLEFSLGSSEPPLASYVPASSEQVRKRMRFGYGRPMPEATQEKYLKIKDINLEHPIWERLWEKQKQRLVPEILPELQKQIDFLKKRIGRFEEIATQDNEELGVVRAQTASERKQKERQKELQKELDEMLRQEEKWRNFTLSRAK